MIDAVRLEAYWAKYPPVHLLLRFMLGSLGMMSVGAARTAVVESADGKSAKQLMAEVARAMGRAN